MMKKIAMMMAVALAGVASAVTLTWNGGSIDSLEGRSFAYNQSASILVTLDVAKIKDETLFKVSGGGKDNANNRKNLAIVKENGSLYGRAAGKDGSYHLGESNSTNSQQLLSAIDGETIKVALTITATANGQGVGIRMVATGGSVKDNGSKFNFDNNAVNGSWGANAPFDTWELSDAVTAVDVVTDVAWDNATMLEKVVVPDPETPDVPEPTALALLALGVAGLALKRKVA